VQRAIDRVSASMISTVAAAGLCLDRAPCSERAAFSIAVDPFDRSETIVATWKTDGDLDGTVQVRSDGTVFGEYFVTRAHPKRPQWFVEAVTAWGPLDDLRCELRLVR